MAPKPSVYLDTSIINFLFADDAPEKKEITEDFFNNFIRTGVYKTWVSVFVLEEINQTADAEKRNKLLNVINEYFIEIIQPENLKEIQTLAQLYLDKAIIPPAKLLDALHVACSVTNRIDYLVSWNYKHLANVNRERRILALNSEYNYFHNIRILTPIELIDYGS